ncbi:MAG: hypothetical protein E7L17_14565 [Clostridium sp.]|uniref:hypothetical protein n=1 Tax=Clostridium sp. TaxID=1506 RepID=UPI002914E5CA|nr:hypothetical protein [Clostridium sp.]MDU7339323.1 hypothetical protein [Clostridium sp.]
MKNTSVFMLCIAFGLLLVSFGTSNIIGILASSALFGYSMAVCLKFEPRRR